MPLARSLAPENVFTQSTPAASSSLATRPLPALAIWMGIRCATLARSLFMISVREVRGTITAVSWIWNLESGIWNLESGIWNQVPEVGHRAPGTDKALTMVPLLVG